MSEKILVTSRSALIEKYGKNGFDEINRAVQALAKADKGRGSVTRLVFLDDQKTMRSFRRDGGDRHQERSAAQGRH